MSGSNSIRSSVKSFDLIVKPNKRIRGIFRYFFAFFSLLELTLRFCYLGFKKKPDVVHCHDSICLIAAVLLKRFVGCCLVYDAHELESNRNGQSRLFVQ